MRCSKSLRRRVLGVDHMSRVFRHISVESGCLWKENSCLIRTRPRPDATVWYQGGDVPISAHDLVLAASKYQDWAGEVRRDRDSRCGNLSNGKDVRLIDVGLQHFGVVMSVKRIQDVADTLGRDGLIAWGEVAELLGFDCAG